MRASGARPHALLHRLGGVLLTCWTAATFAQSGAALEAPMQPIRKQAKPAHSCPGCAEDPVLAAGVDPGQGQERGSPEFPSAQREGGFGDMGGVGAPPLLEVPGVVGIGSSPVPSGPTLP